MCAAQGRGIGSEARAELLAGYVPHAVPYQPGEGLDHIAFRVRDVEETLRLLAKSGVEQVDLPASLADLEEGVRVAYVKDPDGNWIELYQNPRPIEEIPKGY